MPYDKQSLKRSILQIANLPIGNIRQKAQQISRFVADLIAHLSSVDHRDDNAQILLDHLMNIAYEYKQEGKFESAGWAHFFAGKVTEYIADPLDVSIRDQIFEELQSESIEEEVLEKQQWVAKTRHNYEQANTLFAKQIAAYLRFIETHKNMKHYEDLLKKAVDECLAWITFRMQYDGQLNRILTNQVAYLCGREYAAFYEHLNSKRFFGAPTLPRPAYAKFSVSGFLNEFLIQTQSMMGLVNSHNLGSRSAEIIANAKRAPFEKITDPVTFLKIIEVVSDADSDADTDEHDSSPVEKNGVEKEVAAESDDEFIFLDDYGNEVPKEHEQNGRMMQDGDIFVEAPLDDNVSPVTTPIFALPVAVDQHRPLINPSRIYTQKTFPASAPTFFESGSRFVRKMVNATESSGSLHDLAKQWFK